MKNSMQGEMLGWNLSPCYDGFPPAAIFDAEKPSPQLTFGEIKAQKHYAFPPLPP